MYVCVCVCKYACMYMYVQVTFKDALKAADTLKLFACDYSMDFTDLVYQVESSISGFYLEQRTKASTQCKISEWLVKK